MNNTKHAVTITTAEIREGDEFRDDGKLYWTAHNDAERIPVVTEGSAEGADVRVNIVYADGGLGTRFWRSTDEITVQR